VFCQAYCAVSVGESSEVVKFSERFQLCCPNRVSEFWHNLSELFYVVAVCMYDCYRPFFVCFYYVCREAVEVCYVYPGVMPSSTRAFPAPSAAIAAYFFSWWRRAVFIFFMSFLTEGPAP